MVVTSALDVSIVKGIACSQLNWTVDGLKFVPEVEREAWRFVEWLRRCWMNTVHAVGRAKTCASGMVCLSRTQFWCACCSRLMRTAVTLTAWIGFLSSELSPLEGSMSFQNVFYHRVGFHWSRLILFSGCKNSKLKSVHSWNHIEHKRK